MFFKERDLILASKIGDLSGVKSLIERGVNIHADNDNSIRWASLRRHFNVVKYLVEHGADINSNNNESLRNAVMNNDLKMTKYLIEKGANFHDAIFSRWIDFRDCMETFLYIKKIYSERYGDRFLCHNCLVLPVCIKFCSDVILK